MWLGRGTCAVHCAIRGVELGVQVYDVPLKKLSRPVVAVLQP
jgi:hypothetical protein